MTKYVENGSGRRARASFLPPSSTKQLGKFMNHKNWGEKNPVAGLFFIILYKEQIFLATCVYCRAMCFTSDVIQTEPPHGRTFWSLVRYFISREVTLPGCSYPREYQEEGKTKKTDENKKSKARIDTCDLIWALNRQRGTHNYNSKCHTPFKVYTCTRTRNR
jgi:hypothetical protein